MGLAGKADRIEWDCGGVSDRVGIDIQTETNSTTLPPSQLHGRCGFSYCLPIVSFQTANVGSFGADRPELPSRCSFPSPSVTGRKATREVEVKDRKTLTLGHWRGREERMRWWPHMRFSWPGNVKPISVSSVHVILEGRLIRGVSKSLALAEAHDVSLLGFCSVQHLTGVLRSEESSPHCIPYPSPMFPSV